jgi:hypothetical protein
MQLEAVYLEKLFRVQMLASRVRAQALRDEAKALLDLQQRGLEVANDPRKAEVPPGENPVRRVVAELRATISATDAVVRRAGELIRTHDELDETRWCQTAGTANHH